MADAEMAAELQGLQAGEERRGSNASQAVDCCMETMVEQFFAMGADQARSEFDAMCLFLKKFEAYAPHAQMPGKEEERIVRTNKSKTKPVSSWRCLHQAGAMKALQRVAWSLIFLGFRVHLVKAEELGSQVQQRMSEKRLIKLPKSTSHG